jgi:hypothetical protein
MMTSSARAHVMRIQNKWMICVATRTPSRTGVGSGVIHLCSPDVTYDVEIRAWCVMSRTGDVPAYATTHTRACVVFARESAWYCMRGDRPKSPNTTTIAVRFVVDAGDGAARRAVGGMMRCVARVTRATRATGAMGARRGMWTR